MKSKLYIHLFMMLILLSIKGPPLFAQEQQIAKEEADSTFQFVLESNERAWSMFGGESDSLSLPVQVRSCIYSFTNQTVSSFLTIMGCDILAIQNVTVGNGGYLSILANGVVFNGIFDVVGSGVLNVNPLTGNTISTAFNIGTFGTAFQYSDSRNTVNFTNEYGRPSNDVFYMFTLTVPMTVTINHCGSTINDTYLHLLDANTVSIAYNDDYSGAGACSNIFHSYLQLSLSAGTYYIVSEGYSTNGIIQTNVIGEIPQIKYYYDASGNRTARQ